VAATARKAVECFGGMVPGMPRLVDDDIFAFGLYLLRDMLRGAGIGLVDAGILGSVIYGVHRLPADSTADTMIALWQADPNQGSLWLGVVASCTTHTIEA